MAKHEKTAEKHHTDKDDANKTPAGETVNIKVESPDSQTGSPEAEVKAAEAAAALAERDAKIKALEEEVSSLKDQYLRKLADYENFRKRMFREKDDAVQYANSQLLTDLVAVIDDFDRAILSSETSRDFQSLHDGIDMIRKGMLSMLESRYGLQRFESLNKAFDPNCHEAMMSMPGDCSEPTIVEEYCKGYRLKDRILRTAKVKVCMPSGEAAAEPDDTVSAAQS